MTPKLLSTHTKLMIEALLNVHALANMHRASGDEAYLKSAADWLPNLERLMANIKNELLKDCNHDPQ